MTHHDLPDKDELVEEALERAIQREHPIQFTYFKRGHKGEIRTLSPYAVDDEMGSVIGWDHDRDELRRFSLNKCAWPIKDASDDHEYIQPREKGDV